MRTDNQENIFLPILDAPNNQIKHYKQVIPVSVHHFYIADEIGETNKYYDLINTLKTADPHDTVFIYLNTPGGNLYTTVQIISAMRQSQATVVTCLEGEVCSAGTLIFLAGQKHIVNRHCSFMIHNYSHFIGGKGNEVSIRVKHYESYFRELADDLYGGFLTPEEIDSVTQGKDIWLSSKEVITRLNVPDEENNIEAILKQAMVIDRTPDEIPAVECEEVADSPKVKKDRRKTDS